MSELTSSALPVPAGRIQINDVIVDMARQCLVKDQEHLDLEPSAWRLLEFLISTPGQLHSKNKLADIVWRGAVIGDAAISQAVLRIRSVLGDSSKNPRFIETVHRRGYRFIADIVELPLEPESGPRLKASVVVPVDPIPDAPSSLVGRIAEQRKMHLALDRTLRGGFEVVIVEGQSGIGKTALVEHVLGGTTVRGACNVVTVNCVEDIGASEPFLPIFQFMSQLFSQDPKFLEIAQSEAASWVKSYNRVGAGVVPMDKLRREALSALSSLVEIKPIIFVVDNLQWCDPASLDLASFIAQSRTIKNFLLVLCLRTDAMQETPAHALAKKLAARSLASVLRILPLDKDGVAQIVAGRLGFAAGSHDLTAMIDRIWDKTEGHPLFVKLIIDGLVNELATNGEHHADPASILQTRALPQALDDALDVRLSVLSKAGRQMLSAASVVGARFSAPEVACALGPEFSHDEDVITATFEQLIDAEILEEDKEVFCSIVGSSCISFRFAHPLYQQKAYDSVLPNLRREMHARLAHRYSETAAHTRSGFNARLARHYFNSGDIMSAIAYLQKASEMALARGGITEASTYLDQIIDGVAQLQPSPERDLLELRARVRRGLSSQLMPSDALQNANVERVRELADGIWPESDSFEPLVEAYRLMFHCARPDYAGPIVRKLSSMNHQPISNVHAMQMHNVKGSYALMIGNVEEAGTQFEKSKQLMEKFAEEIALVDDQSNQWLLSKNLAGFKSRWLGMSAWIALCRYQIDDAVAHLEQALEIDSAYPTFDGRFMLQMTMVGIYAMGNRQAEAMVLYDQLASSIEELDLQSYVPGYELIGIWVRCYRGEPIDIEALPELFQRYLKFFGATPFPVPATLALEGLIHRSELSTAGPLLTEFSNQIESTRLVRFLPEVKRLQAALFAREAGMSRVVNELLDEAEGLAQANNNLLWLNRIADTRRQIS